MPATGLAKIKNTVKTSMLKVALSPAKISAAFDENKFEARLGELIKSPEKYKIIIAVNAYDKDMKNIIWSTWARDLQNHPEIKLIIFESEQNMQNPFSVANSNIKINGSPKSNSSRTIGILIEVLKRLYDFDYLLICPQNTYVVARRLLNLNLSEKKYVGYDTHGFAQTENGILLDYQSAGLISHELVELGSNPSNISIAFALMKRKIVITHEASFGGNNHQDYSAFANTTIPRQSREELIEKYKQIGEEVKKQVAEIKPAQ